MTCEHNLIYKQLVRTTLLHILRIQVFNKDILLKLFPQKLQIKMLTHMSKNSALAADMMWLRIKTTSSVNLRKFISGPMRNAQGISRVQNSKILARLHDISKITLHFLCCRSATWKWKMCGKISYLHGQTSGRRNIDSASHDISYWHNWSPNSIKWFLSLCCITINLHQRGNIYPKS